MGIFKFDLLYSHSGLEGRHVTLMSLGPREHKGFIKGFEVHWAFKLIYSLPKVGFFITLEKYKDGDMQQINAGLWNTISAYFKKVGTSHQDDSCHRI
jgi:hypothetical protein